MAGLVSLSIGSAFGQAVAQSGQTSKASQETKLPGYDVVSIKINKSGEGSWNIEGNENRFLARNVSLKDLLQNAYGIRKDLISGIAGRVASAHFDIHARVLELDPSLQKLTEKQQRAMLLPILAERFQLKVHAESKTLAVYDLIVVAGGPKVKRSADSGKREGAMDFHNRGRLTTLSAHDVPMVEFAEAMGSQVERTVIDKTGLGGNYDFEMKWSNDDSTVGEGEGAPAIFTAIQEQLGLKLQPAKGPVDRLIVDHVVMPSEN